MALDQPDDRQPDKQENRPRNPQREDEARFPGTSTGKESGVRDPKRGSTPGSEAESGVESNDVDPSGEMDSAGKQRAVPGNVSGDDPNARRPQREDDDQQYRPRRTGEPSGPPIEPDQDPFSKGQTRGA
jgi:hypothetical protein